MHPIRSPIYPVKKRASCSSPNRGTVRVLLSYCYSHSCLLSYVVFMRSLLDRVTCICPESVEVETCLGASEVCRETQRGLE